MQQRTGGGSMHLSRGGGGGSRPLGSGAAATTRGRTDSEDKKMRRTARAGTETMVQRAVQDTPLKTALTAVAANTRSEEVLNHLKTITGQTPMMIRWASVVTDWCTESGGMLTQLDFDNGGCNEDELHVAAVVLLWKCAPNNDDSSTTNKETISMLWELVSCVRDAYNPNPYHSFRHAVDVAQAMFAIICTALPTLFDLTERFCLILSCLLHDVKHNGSTNAVLRQANDPIISKYGSLEQYHAHVAHELLKTQWHVLDEMAPALDKTSFVVEMRRLIVSTDPDTHDRDVADMMINSSRAMQCSALIRMCDISNVVRPFPDAKTWVDRLLVEMMQLRAVGDTSPPPRADVIATWFSQNKALPLVAAFTSCGLPQVTALLMPRLQSNMDAWKSMVPGGGDSTTTSKKSSGGKQS